MKEVNFWNSSRKVHMKRPGFQNNIKDPFKTKAHFGIPVKPLNIKKKNMNWSQAKVHFPRLNPFGDIDRDGVKNKFDCKPFDKKKQDPYFHGTVNIHSGAIKREGLKPSKKLLSHYKTSEKTKPDRIYIFKNPHHAKIYADVVTKGTGFGRPEVLEIDLDPKELEVDPEIKMGEAYSKKGEVKPERIKTYEGNIAYPGEPEEYNYGTPKYKKTAKDIALEKSWEEEDDEEDEEDEDDITLDLKGEEDAEDDD